MSDIVTLNGYKIKDEKAVRSYESIAQMKADTKLKEGYHVKTKGYYEANDGGHGEYVIVDDETLVDDGGSIHVLTNGLRAKLIINDYITPELFGAYGDNTHDDRLAIQKMFDFGNKNMVMNKTYLISDSITLKGENKKLHGTGSINCTHESNPALILNLWNSEIDLIGSIVAKDCIYLRATETDDHWVQYVTIRNVYLDATDKCVLCERTNDKWINEIKFDNVRFSGAYGIHFLGNFNNAGYRLINCGNETCTTAFIKAYNMSDIDIIGLRNAESFSYDLLNIEHTCSSFNIVSSDPICLGKINVSKTESTKGIVMGNVQNDGASRIGSYAVCYHGVFRIEPDTEDAFRMNATNDTYDYTTSSIQNNTNILPANFRIDYVEGGHAYTIKLPQLYKDYHHHLFNIQTFSGASTVTIQYGNSSVTLDFSAAGLGSGIYSVENILGVLYATKLSATQLT